MAGIGDYRHLTYAKLYDLAIARDRIRWRCVSFIAAYASQSGTTPAQLNPYRHEEF